MSWNGFNFNNYENKCNCPECRGVNMDFKHTELDIHIDDPEDILNEYFEIIKDAKNEIDLYGLLAEFFNEIAMNVHKQVVLEEVAMKMELLQALEYGQDID